MWNKLFRLSKVKIWFLPKLLVKIFLWTSEKMHYCKSKMLGAYFLTPITLFSESSLMFCFISVQSWFHPTHSSIRNFRLNIFVPVYYRHRSGGIAFVYLNLYFFIPCWTKNFHQFLHKLVQSKLMFCLLEEYATSTFFTISGKYFAIKQ